MSAQTFRLTPIDTFFFRDSRPYDAGPMQSDAESLFPPPARTLAGALRLALARGRGYDGRTPWRGELAEVLGDGPNDLGKMRFGGPYLALAGEPLYPFPLHVVGKRRSDRFEPETFLAPGPEVQCDLGRARLPEPVRHEAERGSSGGFFLRKDGLESALAGVLPAAVVPPCALYAREPRIGLERDLDKRTAKQGHLYASTHLRLFDGVSLIVEVEGVPDGWAAGCPPLVAVGGESRMAELTPEAAVPPIAAPIAAIKDSGHLTVTLLSALRLSEETMPRPGGALPGLPGARVVSACLGKPVFLGGWNTSAREPLPLRPYLPPGSTWFCTIEEGQADAVCARHGTCIDVEAALGFGAVVLGTWKEI
jgi:CRISPR-associated protein Cmr3